MGTSGSKEGKPERPGMWAQVKQGYGEIVNAIIRPPRAQYTDADLGPSEFTFGGRAFVRTDLELVNPRGLKVVASHWHPADSDRPAPLLPCVIYLHGNSSCRVACMENLEVVLSLGITMFAIDFAGSGRSGGDWVTLGEFEKDDVAAVVEHLRSAGRTSTIALWGRSMGAATALLHSHRDPSMAAIILDSPFADLRQLANEMVEMGKEHTGYRVPGLVIKAAIKMVQQSVLKKADMDINKLKPIQDVDKAFVPALFCHASGDNFIKVHHSRQIYERYASDNKNLVIVDGDHNSARPPFFQHSAGIFLRTAMMVPDDIVLPGDPDLRPSLMSCLTRAKRRGRPLATSEEDLTTAATLARHRMLEEEMMRQAMAVSMLGARRKSTDGEAEPGAGYGDMEALMAAEVPFTLADDVVPPSHEWNCPACTFLNSAGVLVCGVCQSQFAPVMQEEPPAAAGAAGGAAAEAPALPSPPVAPLPGGGGADLLGLDHPEEDDPS